MDDTMLTRIGGTVSLVRWLEDQERVLDKSRHDDLVVSVGDRIRGWISRILEVPSGIERAKFIHKALDKAVESSLRDPGGLDISCKKRCSYCCHIHVAADENEAALLYDWVKRSGYKIDMERLRKQAATTSDATYNKELGPHDSRCVFLGKDGLCAAYSVRPASCRKYFVVNNPKDCSPYKGPDRGVQTVFIPEGEIIVSAALSIYGGTQNNLAKTILPLLEKEHGEDARVPG